MNRNLRDIAVRVVKTFFWAMAGALISTSATVAVTWATLGSVALIGLVAALVSLVQNLLGVSPTSIPGRAAQTFVQAFGAFIVVAGYTLSGAVVTGAIAAAVSATVNFLKSAE